MQLPILFFKNENNVNNNKNLVTVKLINIIYNNL